MKLIETSVTATSVRMRFADQVDPAKATRWLDFQVPLDGLLHANNQVQLKIDDLDLQLLGEVRRAALLAARGIIGAESRRIEAQLDHKR